MRVAMRILIFKLLAMAVLFVVVLSAGSVEMGMDDSPRTKQDIAMDVERDTRCAGGVDWYRARLRVECMTVNPPLPYPAMRRTMWLESRENPKDVEIKKGRKISFGLFQLSRETGMQYHYKRGLTLPKMQMEKWLLDPENNIVCAVWWFDHNRRMFRGDWKKTIMAHNLGPDGARKMYAERGYWWPHSGQNLGPRLDQLCRARVYGERENN